MQITKLLNQLQQSEDFKGWKNLNPDNFFSYALKTVDEKSEQPWQLGFFNKQSQKMVTFIVSDSEITIQPEEEVFKKPDTNVEEINLEKVTQPYDQIMERTADFVKETYPKELINKKIIILQNLENFGTIWNLTMISQTFNTINIKINADTAEILHHSCENFMNFIQKDQ